MSQNLGTGRFTVTANTNQFNQKLRQASNTANQFGRNVGNAARQASNNLKSALSGASGGAGDFVSKIQGLTSSFGPLGKAVTIAASALGAFKVAQEAIDLAKFSSSVETTQRAFRALTAEQGLDPARFVGQLRDATQGYVTESRLFVLANRLLIQKNEELLKRIPNVYRNTIRLAQAQGLDLQTSIEDVTLAILRQSPLILDNIGIQLKLSQAYAIYAAQLGKTVSALTAEEKQLAFLVAAEQKAIEAGRALGEITDNVAASSNRLAVAWDNLRTQLGKKIEVPAQVALNTLSQIIEQINKALESQDRFNREFIEGQEELARRRTNLQAGGGAGSEFLTPLPEGALQTAQRAQEQIEKSRQQVIAQQSANEAQLLRSATERAQKTLVEINAKYLEIQKRQRLAGLRDEFRESQSVIAEYGKKLAEKQTDAFLKEFGGRVSVDVGDVTTPEGAVERAQRLLEVRNANVEAIQRTIDATNEATEQTALFVNVAGQGLINAVVYSDSFADSLKNIVRQLAAAVLQAKLLQPLIDGIYNRGAASNLSLVRGSGFSSDLFSNIGGNFTPFSGSIGRGGSITISSPISIQGANVVTPNQVQRIVQDNNREIVSYLNANRGRL